MVGLLVDRVAALSSLVDRVRGCLVIRSIVVAAAFVIPNNARDLIRRHG